MSKWWLLFLLRRNSPGWTPHPLPSCRGNILVTSSQVECLEVLQPTAEGGSLTHSERSYGCELWPIFLPFSSDINRLLNLSKMSLKHQWNMIKLSEEGMFWFSPIDITPTKMQNDLFVLPTIGEGLQLAGTELGMGGKLMLRFPLRASTNLRDRPMPRWLQGSVVRAHSDGGLLGASCWVRLCPSKVVLKP